jgi:hypothetical protein
MRELLFAVIVSAVGGAIVFLLGLPIMAWSERRSKTGVILPPARPQHAVQESVGGWQFRLMPVALAGILTGFFFAGVADPYVDYIGETARRVIVSTYTYATPEPARDVRQLQELSKRLDQEALEQSRAAERLRKERDSVIAARRNTQEKCDLLNGNASPPDRVTSADCARALRAAREIGQRACRTVGTWNTCALVDNGSKW